MALLFGTRRMRDSGVWNCRGINVALGPRPAAAARTEIGQLQAFARRGQEHTSPVRLPSSQDAVDVPAHCRAAWRPLPAASPVQAALCPPVRARSTEQWQTKSLVQCRRALPWHALERVSQKHGREQVVLRHFRGSCNKQLVGNNARPCSQVAPEFKHGRITMHASLHRAPSLSSLLQLSLQ